jgi:hypothetical protein
MSNTPVIFRKEVAALPVILEANTLYFVRVGEGFDLYLSDLTGAIAHKVNSGDGSGGNTDLEEFTEDPENPRPGQQWLLRSAALAPAPLLTGFWGMAFPMPTVISVEAHALSINTSFGIKRTPLQ